MSVLSSAQSQRRAGAVDVKKVACLGMLCAVAYAVVCLSKIIFGPLTVAGFLTFDLKDVVIAIGGFLFGPLSAVLVSVVVSVIEMISISGTGPWGLLMNVLATVAFVCPAAYLYKKRHTFSAALLGLVIGGVCMTVVMLLWNYLITPIYLGYPRDAVAAMLVPIFLPFNLIKALMNGALTMLLYKPVVTALRKARLVPEHESAVAEKKNRTWGVTIIAVVALATAVLLGLVLAGVI